MNPPRTLPRWSGTLAIVAAVIVAYAAAWHAGFIWDDDAHVTTNPCIIGPLGLRQIWTSASADYFPLTLTAFWFLHAVFGLNAMAYHVTTVLLHAACAVALWRVLCELRVPGAWLGALLWALHPVQVESVAWISEMKNTQSCLFFLASVWCFLRWLGQPREPAAARGARGWYAAALLCGVLAILSKASTVMLPLALALCAWWRDRAWNWKRLPALVPFLLVAAVASGWTIWEQKVHSGASGPEWSQTWPQRFAISGHVVWFYLAKLVWPRPLVFIYPRWPVGVVSAASFLPLAAALAVLAVLWFRRNGALRPLFCAYAYFLALLFPVMGFFSIYFFRFSFVADHFQYLASIGPLALAGGALVTAVERLRRVPPGLRIGLAATPVVVLAVLTARQTRIYHDDVTLFQATVARNPGAWMADSMLSHAHENAGDIPGAIAQLKVALRLNPNFALGEVCLGALLVKAGEPAAAIPHFQRALQLQPDYPEATYNLGIALAKTGRLADAIGCFSRAVAVRPDFVPARTDLAFAMQEAGRPQAAIAEFETVLRSTPKDPQIHFALGLALARTGQLARAADEYRAALALAPAMADAHNSLGNVLCALGENDAAVAEYQQALRLHVRYPSHTYCNLGRAQVRLGRTADAIAAYREALQLEPGLPQARMSLAMLLGEPAGAGMPSVAP